MDNYLAVTQFVTHLLIAGFCGLFGMVIATSKGRSRWLGFILGAVGLLLGWIVLWLIPRKRGPSDSVGAQMPAR